MRTRGEGVKKSTTFVDIISGGPHAELLLAYTVATPAEFCDSPVCISKPENAPKVLHNIIMNFAQPLLLLLHEYNNVRARKGGSNSSKTWIKKFLAADSPIRTFGGKA